MPVEEQGENGTISVGEKVNDGICSDDSDTSLGEAMKSAVSEYLRPHSLGEEEPLSFPLAAERQVSSSLGGIDKMWPLEWLS